MPTKGGSGGRKKKIFCKGKPKKEAGQKKKGAGYHLYPGKKKILLSGPITEEEIAPFL